MGRDGKGREEGWGRKNGRKGSREGREGSKERGRYRKYKLKGRREWKSKGLYSGREGKEGRENGIVNID